MVTFQHTYLHILVLTFTGNLNLNFKILSEQKEFTLTNHPKYSLSLSPCEVTFSLLNRSSKTNHKFFHKQVFVKSLLVHASGDALPHKMT